MNGNYWQAIGFVTVTADTPAFAIPLFCRPGGNSTVVQRTDEHGRVAEFDPLGDAPDQLITDIDNGPRIRIGDRPLWAFRLKPGEHVLGSEEEVREWLKARAHAPELQAAALTRLSVVRFAGLEDELVPALRAAHAVMAQISDKTARYWRDNVILAPKVRERIAALNSNEVPDFRFEVKDGKAEIALSAEISSITRQLSSDQELSAYLKAFTLSMDASLVTPGSVRPKGPWTAVTAVHTRSIRAMRYLDRHGAGTSVQVAAFDDLVNGMGVNGLRRVYVFVDGTEGIDPSHVRHLRQALPSPCPIHLLWADYGAQLPGPRHTDAVDAVTLLPARSLWAGSEGLDRVDEFSVSQRLAAFLILADARRHAMSPLSVFVAAYRNDQLDGPRDLANRLWVSAINPILPIWEAHTLIYAGMETDTPDVRPTLSFRDASCAYPPIFSKKGEIIAHLYEGWKQEEPSELNIEGYMEAFQLMGWNVGWSRGEDSFTAESATTGPIQVLPFDGGLDRTNVHSQIDELRARLKGPHVVIPIGLRPGAEALALMCLAGLNVVLPHRLPLMAKPENEWAMLYPPLSQFNGAQLRRVLGSRIAPFLADYVPEPHIMTKSARLDVTRATKSAGGASIQANLELLKTAHDGGARKLRMTITLSPRGLLVQPQLPFIED